jgi:hypothetical protein
MTMPRRKKKIPALIKDPGSITKDPGFKGKNSEVAHLPWFQELRAEFRNKSSSKKISTDLPIELQLIPDATPADIRSLTDLTQRRYIQSKGRYESLSEIIARKNLIQRILLKVHLRVKRNSYLLREGTCYLVRSSCPKLR